MKFSRYEMFKGILSGADFEVMDTHEDWKMLKYYLL